MMRPNLVGTLQLGRLSGLLLMVDVYIPYSVIDFQHRQLCSTTLEAWNGIPVVSTLKEMVRCMCENIIVCTF